LEAYCKLEANPNFCQTCLYQAIVRTHNYTVFGFWEVAVDIELHTARSLQLLTFKKVKNNI